MSNYSSTGSYERQNKTLEVVEYEYFIQHIVGFIFLSLVGLVGLFGNLHVILLYLIKIKPSNHRTMIIILAVLDFGVNTTVIPMDLYSLRHHLTAVNFICTMFTSYFLTSSSGFMMLFISIERYRKVCVPLGRQFAVSEIKIICAALIALCLLLALPTFFLYGSETYYSQKLGFTVTTCNVVKESAKTDLAMRAYTMVLLLIVLVLAVICGICYMAIGFIIKRQRKIACPRTITERLKITLAIKAEMNSEDLIITRQNTPERSTDSNFKNEITSEKTKVHTPELSKSSSRGTKRTNTIRSDTEDSNQELSQDLLKKKKRNKRKTKTQYERYRRSERLTLMFFIATILTYVFFVISVIFICLEINEKTKLKVEKSLGPVYLIFRKFAFLGSVINPFVYGFFDQVFRKAFKEFYMSILRHLRCIQID